MSLCLMRPAFCCALDTSYQQDHFWYGRTTIGINFRSGGGPVLLPKVFPPDRFWPRAKIFVTRTVYIWCTFMDDDPDQPRTATADEEIVDLVQEWKDERRRVVLVTAGRAGVGKSTLINNFLLGLKREKAAEAKRSARSVTKNVHYYEEEVHGITLCIINTPGLESRDLTREQEALTTLSELTNNKPDLLLYCISLVGGYKDKDDHIVARLTDAFGGEIWRHAILVLTHGDELEDDEEENRELLNKFTEEFEKSLEKAGVNDVPVKFILSTQDIGHPDQLEAVLAKREIVGVPVGRCITSPKDWVFLIVVHGSFQEV